MTLMLEIAPEVERVLEARARRRGLPLATYILELAERDAAAKTEVEAQANVLWLRLTNDSTHNNAITTLAQTSEAVRAIAIQRSADAAVDYYASPAGMAEVEELSDWRALDGDPFQNDEVDGGDCVR